MSRNHHRWAGAIVVAILALEVAWVGWGFGGERATQAFSDLISVLTAGGAALACLGAARRERGRLRQGWRMLGLGMASWAAGEWVWSWYELVEHREVPFPSSADIGFLGLIPLAAWGVLAFAEGNGRSGRSSRTILDGMLIAGSVLFVSWAVVLGAQFHQSDGSLLEKALTLAYPLGDVVVVTAVLCAALSVPPTSRLAFTLVAVGLTGLCLADSGFFILNLDDAYATGSLIDPLWDFGFLLVLLGALRHEPAAPRPPWPRARSKQRIVLLPYLPIAVAVVTAGWKQLAGSYGPFLFWNGIAVVLVGMTRQCLTLLDNAQLARDLEAKVEARTEELRQSERRFRSLVQNASDVIVVVGADTTIHYVSASAERVLGYPPQDLLGTRMADLAHAEDANRVLETVAAVEGDGGTLVKWRCRHEDGRWLEVETLTGEFSDDPDRAGFVVSLRDVSERTALEVRLQQAERLESLGHLAGGIAHDFNNLLVVIQSCASFLAEALPEPAPPGWEPIVNGIRSDAGVIARAAQRGEDLTSQLLTFARRDQADPRILDVNDVVGRAEDLLRRTLGEHVTLETKLNRPLGAVRADPRRIEQVLVNLAVNARDAMQPGGRLTINTEEIEVTTFNPIEGLPPGRFVCITETDTGRGMRPEVLARALEPFFTTKPRGQGTGLGLATVFGIVTEAGGHLHIDSAPGQGTAVHVYLPALRDVPRAPSEGATRDDFEGHGETVLLVEDEAMVRAVAGRILGEHGYEVLVAADSSAALRWCLELDRSIDVVVTDVVMPGLSGPELVGEIRGLRPAIPALFISGYPADFLKPTGQWLRGESPEVIRKPFTPNALLRGVRRALDHAAAPAD